MLVTLIPVDCCFILTHRANIFTLKIFGIKLYNSSRREKEPKSNDKLKKKQDKQNKNPAPNPKTPKTKNKNNNSNNNKKNKAPKSEDNKDKKQDKDSLKETFKYLIENKVALKYAVSKLLKCVLKILSEARVQRLYINIKTAGEDAYEAAKNYVIANQIVWGVLGLSSSLLSVKRKSIKISPLFTKEETEYHISFRIRLVICNLIAALIMTAAYFLKLMICIRNDNMESLEKNNIKTDKEQSENMKDDNKLKDLMGVTMEKIRDMVDVNTIIGQPIQAGTNVTIIPVSRVSYGFGSGGSDLPVSNSTKELFGGGAGAGISIKPIGFLVVQDSDVKFIQISEEYRAANSVIDKIPGVVDTISAAISKRGEKKKDKETSESTEE